MSIFLTREIKNQTLKHWKPLTLRKIRPTFDTRHAAVTLYVAKLV
jgi:hypothetical protein